MSELIRNCSLSSRPCGDFREPGQKAGGPESVVDLEVEITPGSDLEWSPVTYAWLLENPMQNRIYVYHFGQSRFNLQMMPNNSTNDIITDTRVLPGLILAAFIPLLLVTGGANILVMICTRVDRTLRTVSSLYIFSLALADAIVGFTVMAGMLLYSMYGYWPLSQVACTAWICLDFSCVTVSMFHLCIIAHDRYVALVNPVVYQQERTTKDALIRLCTVWFLGVAVWMPAVLFTRHRLWEDLPEGDCFFVPQSSYVLIQATLVYYLPTFIMIFFYVRCLRILYRKFNETTSGRPKTIIVVPVDGTSLTPSSTTGSTGAITPSSQGQSRTSNTVATVSGHRRHQRYLRTFRTLGVVILVFLLCWGPFCVLWPVASFCWDCIPQAVYEYCYWSAYLNSTINPFLYFFSNRDFRVALRRLFKCKKRRPSE